MADYDPPIENLPIFDSLVFKTGDEFITQRQGDKRYLRYPNAQGTENLQTVNISGTLNASGISNFTNNINASGISNFTNDLNSSDVLNIYDATLPEQNKVCLNLESQGVPLSRLRFSLNPTAGFLNPTVRTGDIAMCYGTSDPNLTAIAIAPVCQTSCGLRMSREGIGLGSGGTGVEPLNRIIITPTIFSLVANGTQKQIDVSHPIIMNSTTGLNRQLTTSYVNLTDITLNTPTVRMYGSGTNIAMDNNIIMSNASSANRNISATFYNYTLQSDNSTIAASFMTNGGVLFCDNNFNGGQFGFTVNDSGGIQRSPLTMSANAFTIASVNPPTSSATIPANDNTTALATTAWTQALIVNGRTQTISITSTTTITVPTGVIGIGIRMIGKGGIPGLNADTGSNYSSGGTGGGASSITSNGMVPIVGGSVLYSIVDALGVSLRYLSTIFVSCSNGNNGGNASGTTGGTGAVAQTGGSGLAGYGSYSLSQGNAGVAGIGNQGFGSITGVPSIAATSTSSSSGIQGFIDGARGCGQRYRYVAGNGYITSTTAPADAIIYLTYFYI